ncbi:hypothetical protein CABS01_03549 [Colletotrichum abscissum]|nr:uncharacterized protein CABS01_03549 [Colletotrichum abscissum]KAK1475272.1 hypothetical protein CABS01_03549 [Colletotrichum abscissum]
MASCKWTGRNLGMEWKARLGAGRRAGAEQKNSCDLQKTDCVTDWEWWRRGVFGGGGCSVTVGSGGGGGGGGGGGRRWRRGVTGRASQTVNDAPALGPLTAQTYTVAAMLHWRASSFPRIPITTEYLLRTGTTIRLGDD